MTRTSRTIKILYLRIIENFLSGFDLTLINTAARTVKPVYERNLTTFITVVTLFQINKKVIQHL